MFDNEKDITDVRDGYFHNRIQTTITNLNRNRIKAFYAPNKEIGVSLILELIDSCMDYNREHYHKGKSELRQSIGFGDSLTLHQMGLFEYVYGGGNT